MPLVIRVTWNEFNRLTDSSWRRCRQDPWAPFVVLLNEAERARLEGERGVRVAPQCEPPLIRLDVEEP
jgi:hypothetical protein